MKRLLWVLPLVFALLLSSCGPAMQPAAGPDTETGEVFMIALPRIVIDFDANGAPSVMGVRLADISTFTGVDLSMLQLNPFYVNWMMAANVQHIEMRQTGNGLVMFVNGKPMPHVGWTDEGLRQASDFAGLFNVQNTAMIRKFLPIVRRLGLDIVLRFPAAAGASELALVDPEVAVATVGQKSSEGASAVMKFEVRYDDAGAPAILGITPADLAAMGISLGAINLAPSVISMLQTNNIQTIELAGKSDGVFIFINGVALPNVVWDDAMLANAAELYVQMNPQSPYVDLARTFTPLVNNADINVLVHFPVAAGVEKLPAQMH